jgi:sigma-B regulation protein RsbU (phosphoserine phosphatase)
MGIFTAVLVLLWFLKLIFLTPDARQFLSPGQQVSIDLLTLLLAVPAVYYGWRLSRLIRSKLLWKIRRRLILAHIFIGAIPVLLVIVILWVTALLFYYQFSYYLIANQIGIHTAQVHAFNLSLRAGLQQALASGGTSAGLRAVLDRDSQYLLGAYPSASVLLRAQSTGDSFVVIGNKNVNSGALGKYQVPRWAGDREFSGLVLEDAQPDIYETGLTGRENGLRGRLFLRSLVFSDLRPEAPFSVEISVPFDSYLLGRLKAALGQDLLLADHVELAGLNVMQQSTDILQRNVVSATFDPDDPSQSLGRSVWSILLFPISWNSGLEAVSNDSQVLFVELSTSKLIQNVFRSESNVSKTILGVLQIVIGFFLVVEIASLVLGIVLTKSITSAVFNLYRGTEFVKRGDFSHRIVVRSNDQLGALASSFNQMTEYVQSLVKERVQKERLERELEIAKEVQEQLFPRFAPQMGRMELTGLCLPARVVSGDYYDFLHFNVDRLGLALGDICGKGISAALLMANLQATLRSNVIQYFRDSEPLDYSGTVNGAVANVVRILNEQIYSYTSSNKYASFFYAVYDDRYPSLTYCNAGHNPPLYFSGGGWQRLLTGGTVVGIFADAEYEQETLQLKSGDLLVAYTDGIVECVNEYGEEFGEERLVNIIRQNRGVSADNLQKVVVEHVLNWAYEEERDDDMTLIVAKIR